MVSRKAIKWYVWGWNVFVLLLIVVVCDKKDTYKYKPYKYNHQMFRGSKVMEQVVIYLSSTSPKNYHGW